MHHCDNNYCSRPLLDNKHQKENGAAKHVVYFYVAPGVVVAFPQLQRKRQVPRQQIDDPIPNDDCPSLMTSDTSCHTFTQNIRGKMLPFRYWMAHYLPVRYPTTNLDWCKPGLRSIARYCWPTGLWQSMVKHLSQSSRLDKELITWKL